MLLDAGADRNARDVDGNTPAHIAAEGEDADQLRMLASETWQDSPNLNGETVKDILCRKVTLAKERQKIGVNFEFAAQTLESFRFEDQNEDEDEDEALKPFRLQLGRDNVVAINFVVPAKLKTKKFEDFLVSKTKCFVLVLVFVLVLESKALYYISLKI